MNRAAHRVLFG